MSFDDIYRKTSKVGQPVKEVADDQSYKLSVPVHVYFEKFEGDIRGEDVIVDPPEVTITYDLEISHASWGIKDMNVSIREIEDFTVAVANSEDLDVEPQQIPVKVEPEAIDILWEAGSGFAPDMLEVTLDKQGRVKSSELSFYYYKP